MSPTERIPEGPTQAPATAHERLLAIKLRALVGDHVGAPVDVAPLAFPQGSALVVDGAAWVLVDGAADRSLGRALAWASRVGAASLDVVAERDTGLLARRAAAFEFPIAVWHASDRVLLPAVAEPVPLPPSADPEHLALCSLIEEAGAEPAVEHGVVFGEVRGLEVCRVVSQPTVGHFAESVDAVVDPVPGVRLEVGVGAADREAFSMLHGDVPTVDALADVVRSVRAHRSAGAPQHPLNRLARERFLRWEVSRDPSEFGLRALRPAEPPLPRPNLKDPVPCVAAGDRADGAPVTVVFSSGVDLDLMPFVADVAAMTDDELMVALPTRDLLPVQHELAGMLRRPVVLAGLEAGRSLGSS